MLGFQISAADKGQSHFAHSLKPKISHEALMIIDRDKHLLHKFLVGGFIVKIEPFSTDTSCLHLVNFLTVFKTVGVVNCKIICRLQLLLKIRGAFPFRKLSYPH